MTENAWDQVASSWGLDGEQPERVSEAPSAERKSTGTESPLKNLNATMGRFDPQAAQEAVLALLHRYMEGQPLPLPIAGFLNTHWRSYMSQLYIREGEQSKSWRKALINTDDLTWSLQPKCDDESRRRLYMLLPGLFQWLHAVLKSQQVAVADEDLFFAELARLQVAALHAEDAQAAEPGAGPELAARDQPGEQVPREQPPSEQRNQVAGSAGVNTRRAGRAVPPGTRGKAAGAGETTSSGSGPLRDLVVGAYVEFQSERATKRIMRLDWISRSAGVYLFRDPKRGDTICLTAERCLQCFRERTATILSGCRK